MRLLITVLTLSVPLVLSLRTRRAPGDESREDDLCSHPLHSSLCETSKLKSPVARRNTGSESAAANALNDMRVIPNNRFDEVRTPSPTLHIHSSTIITSPSVTLIRTTTQAPEHFPHTQTDPSTTSRPTTRRTENPTTAASLHVPPMTHNTPEPTTSDTPMPIPHDPGYVRCVFGISSTGQCRMIPPDTRLSPVIRTGPLTPAITARHLLQEANDTPDPGHQCGFAISSTGECIEPPPGVRLSPSRRDEPLPPSITALQLQLATNNTPKPTTSEKPTITTLDPKDLSQTPCTSSLGPCTTPEPSFDAVRLLQDNALLKQVVTNNTPKPTTSYTPTITTQDPKDLSQTPCISWLGPCTTPEPPFDAVPLLQDNSLYKQLVPNNTPKPTTSYTPTPTMQATMFYKYRSPESLPSPRATLPPPATSVHLPQVTNTLVSPTTSYTPTRTTPYPPQPQPTRPATNRPSFHDACSTILTDATSNPGRWGSVPCVLNIANYYDQVHYHQTIHNHYGA